MSDSSEEAQQKLAALEAKYADDLTRSEAQFVEVAESLLGQGVVHPAPAPRFCDSKRLRAPRRDSLEDLRQRWGGEAGKP